MLSAALEDRFRQALGDEAAGNDEAIRFAVDCARLIARVAAMDPGPATTAAMQRAILARTDLSRDRVMELVDLALAPENRMGVSEDELRTFGARFGFPAEQALRNAVAEEIDLQRFAEHYGEAEALLLLDALFAVCAVDGQIDRSEIARLRQAARELNVDEMLVGALFRKHDVRHAAGDFRFELDERERWLIGRANTSNVPLPDPQVAIRHAELVRSPDGWRVVDLGSGRPTLLNGVPVASAPFKSSDSLRIGPYTLSLDATGKTLFAFGLDAFSALSVRELQRRIGDIVLLDEVDFTVFSGEVIALVGPSGAGKTTLLNAIAGIAPPDTGDVLFDGSDFHTMLANDRSLVGIVPQEDVVHGELTVEESLRFAGELRFGADVEGQAIEREVDRVLDELGIEHIRGSRVGSALRRGISGGQRKRVNLGQELLTRTTKVLFLDEPTSGLDPQTAQDIVRQVRQLADDGRIVFIVTHDVAPTIMALVDHLMVLAPGGRLAWFGPPDEACTYFGVKNADQIFSRMADRTPTDWKDAYRASPAYKKYVTTREHLLGLDGVDPPKSQITRSSRRSSLKQFLTLTRRYWTVKWRDLSGTGVLLSQAPILGVAMWIVFPKPDIATMFMLSLSVLWFGSSAAVRELIAERTIWRREARTGLKLWPYMASKLTVLGVLVLLQTVMLTSIVYFALDMPAYGYSWLGLNTVTAVTGFVGISLGMLVSAVFSSSEAAVGTLPLVLIPQIAFGGLIVKVKNMTVASKVVANLMITRFSFEWAIKTGDELSKPAHKGYGESTDGIQRFLWELGFRTSSADDMGLPAPWLFAILAAFFLVFLSVATIFVARSREGN